MQVAVDELELQPGWLDSDPAARWRLAVALARDAGTESCSLMYLELEPGCRLPRHIDSAEELVLVLSGSATVTIGGRDLQVADNGVAVVPQEVPHEVRNTGSDVLRVVGFYAAASPVSTFEEPVMPNGERVRETTA